MSQSFENFDKPYRRGLVLGLSLAEVFLILIFLLLLASIGIVDTFKKEIKEAKIEKQELQDSLDALRKVIGRNITTEEFTRLQKDAAARQRLIRENKELSDRLAETESQLDQANEWIESLERISIKPDDLKELRAKQKSLEKELENKEKEVAKIAKILDSTKDKGRSPPCWFRLVPDTKSGANNKRQKDVKIFDVKIEDDGLYVIKHDNTKTPRPIDFGNQSKRPPFAEDLLNRKLTEKEFKAGFISFYRAGNNNVIQP